MAEIASDLRRAVEERVRRGGPGGTTGRALGAGEGWAVEDVLCTSGPRDRPFEERHTRVGIAIVAAGTFEYRGAAGRQLLTPGALLLGNMDQPFECAHDHAAGDRCLSFHYAPEHFERLAADAGGAARFPTPRLPPLRELSPLVARALAALSRPRATAWEELAVALAVRVARLVAGLSSDPRTPLPSAVARVSRTVRQIDSAPGDRLTLTSLAREAGLSTYHFLRTFESVTGLTPHQYVRRARLRQAALQLEGDTGKVTDVALDAGFGDISNFNRSFRAEFGLSPRAYRAASAARRGPATA